MAESITTQELLEQIKSENHPLILDVRRMQAFQENPNVIPGAEYKSHEAVAVWANDLPTNKDIVVYCVHGHQVSQNVASELEQRGFRVKYLAGGIALWQPMADKSLPDNTMYLPLFLVLILCVLASSSLAEPAFTQQKSKHLLSEKEIKKAFTGMVISDNAHWSAYLLTDGSVKAVQMGEVVQGRWKISEQQFCMSIPESPEYDCWPVAKNADGYVFLSNDEDFMYVTAEPLSDKYHLLHNTEKEVKHALDNPRKTKN